MAGIGERLKGLLRGENRAAEDSAKAMAENEAMSRDDFQEAIEAQLNDLPEPLVSAFAARLGNCALSFLVNPPNGDFLGFWKTKVRDRHLLSIFLDVQSALAFARFNRQDNFTATFSYVRAAVVDRAYADNFAIANGYSVYNRFANYATEAAEAASANRAFTYAASAAFVADIAAAYASSNYADTSVAELAAHACTNSNLQAVFLLEIHQLIAGGIDAISYLARPLPPEIEPQARLFIARLREYGNGFDWWADWYEDRLLGRPFDLEILKQSLDLPESLLNQGPAAVNAYLKSLTRREATQPLNRIRLIFLGYGQSGKTSLVRALHNEDVVAGEGDMTPGIEIREWPVPESAIKAHVWDFGGQVMAHATHQFFLRESCVYVLVMEPRAEINANQQAQYWLEHVRLFGKDAPVLLVGNKVDVTALHLDLNTLKDSYPNLVGFFPLSCTGYRDQYRHEFEIFRNALAAALRQAGTHQLLFTPRHFAVLVALRQRPKDQAFLPKPDYEALCDRHQVAAAGELDRGWLLDLLDKLGEVVHFPGIDWLGAYVLNPRWLTYGVYTLLYSEEARVAAGRLTQGQVITILGRGGCPDNAGNPLAFSPVQSRFILDAMQRFELCYALPEAADTFILPDLLSSDRPDELGFDKNQALAFDLDFAALLPRHLMTSFIVRRHAEIARQRVWQNGVVLGSRNWQAEALVQADHHRRRLSLWVAGKDAARYFTTLHDEFMLMLDRLKMRPPQYLEWVVLPGARFAAGEEPPRVDFRDLLAQEAKGQTEHTCKHGTFKLTEILKIMPKDEREKQAGAFAGASLANAQIFFGDNRGQAQAGTGNQFNWTLPPEARQMDKTLADLHYEVGAQVEDEALRGQALRELEMIRQALQKIEKGGAEDRHTALDTLSRFGDKLKEGSGGTVKALKSLQDGGEAVAWLIDKAPAIIAGLAGWLA